MNQKLLLKKEVPRAKNVELPFKPQNSKQAFSD
jgi:hypothetical protein